MELIRLNLVDVKSCTPKAFPGSRNATEALAGASIREMENTGVLPGDGENY